MTDDDSINEFEIEEGDRFRLEAERITPEYASEVTDHINRMAVAPDDACPVCGHWFNTVTSTPYRITALPAGDAYSSGEIMPVLASACHNCGFVRFFHRDLVDRAIARHKSGDPLLTPPRPSELGDEDGS